MYYIYGLEGYQQLEREKRLFKNKIKIYKEIINFVVVFVIYTLVPKIDDNDVTLKTTTTTTADHRQQQQQKGVDMMIFIKYRH